MKLRRHVYHHNSLAGASALNRGVLLLEKKGNLNRKYFNHLGIALSSLVLCGCTPAFFMPGSLPATIQLSTAQPRPSASAGNWTGRRSAGRGRRAFYSRNAITSL
jgi:hypothetical protein